MVLNGGPGRCLVLLANLVLQVPSAPSFHPVERKLAGPSHVRLVLELDRRNDGALEPGVLDTARLVLQRRLEEFGARDVMVDPGPDERLVVEANGITEPGRLEWLLTTVGRLEFRITDMRNRFRDALPDIDGALRRAGVRAPTSATAGGPGPSFPQKQPTEPFSSLLFQGQLPGEYLVVEGQVPAVERLLARADVQRLIPPGIDLKWGVDVRAAASSMYRTLYAVEHQPIMRGDAVERAVAQRESHQAVVAFTLSERAGRIFKRETGRHVNDYLAIILDGQVQGQPPIVRSPIGRRGQIELGDKPLADGQDLAAILTAGSLPAPLVLVDEQILGTSSPVREVVPWQIWAALAAVVVWVAALFALARRRKPIP
ncbi:MAG TPA: hypothetical protein VEU74_13110 [Gemmatimonadales bacterium]|nr:hypothetical protein [Gemmatimonadales bacterium]